MHLGHRVIDGHVHFILDANAEYFAELLERTGTDMANLASIDHGGRVSCTPELLAIKHRFPGRFYAFGNLDPCLYYRGGEDMGRQQSEYAKMQLESGCDGVKLLEGKPQLRRALPIPDFDLPCWDEFWAWAEESGTPILWHVNDPEAFWDESKVPAWAKTQGWAYDGSYINNEEQYRQVLTVLERHPRLKICFAHFFFMSAQLDRLDAILDCFPNIRTDLTPGIEMYENFSLTPDKTRAFFEKHHDRIIYGTDIGSRFVFNPGHKPFNEKENLRRPEIVRAFLSNTAFETVRADGNFVIGRPDFDMMGLGLSGERLDGILSLNFLRFAGEKPREVSPAAALVLCRDTREKLSSAQKLPGFTADFSGIDAAEAYFSDFIKYVM